MTKRQIYTAVFSILAIPFLRTVPAFAHGDKVLPQVADGAQSNGIKYRTKFDISNISFHLNTVITHATVYFYNRDGSPWTVALKDPTTGNTINVSSYTLNLGTLQTVRLETVGAGDLHDGYAVIRNLETTTDLPDDGEIAVTAYFEVLALNSHGGYDIIDTISVPTSQPTVSWSFPVEIDSVGNLLTGYAMVNLSDQTNNITIDLYAAKNPLSTDASVADFSLSVNLASREKTVGFLSPADFFQTVPAKFKGMAIASSTAPVAFLSLLQTPTPSGVQFATLVPTNLDSLRRNTLMYLPQGYSLDADLMISDYFRDETAAQDNYYETPWDVLFQSGGTSATRFIVPQQIAMVSGIGVKSGTEFDALGLSALMALNYATDPIDLGNDARTSKLIQGYTFAIKTGLGRYVKVRIRNWVTYTGSTNIDLMLEIYAYR